MQIKYILCCLLAYLLGSINTSIIVSKIMLGDDIRNHGSGNAGATNTLRSVGKLGALLVVIGDALKTAISILLARLILDSDPNATYLAGVFAVLGHNFPLYFKFKGGKGVLASAVAMLFADPYLGLIVIFTAIMIMAISKFVSLGSVLGSILFFILGTIRHYADMPFMIFAAILSILVIYMHRENIKRLLSGTENKISFNKKN